MDPNVLIGQMIETVRWIKKMVVDFKVKKEHMQVRLKQLESLSNGVISKVIAKSVNSLIKIRMKIDELLDGNKERVHQFIENLLIGV